MASTEQQRRYRQSEKGKASTKRYYMSEKGKASAKRYDVSEKGRARRARDNENQRRKRALAHKNDTCEPILDVNYRWRVGTEKGRLCDARTNARRRFERRLCAALGWEVR